MRPRKPTCEAAATRCPSHSGRACAVVAAISLIVTVVVGGGCAAGPRAPSEPKAAVAAREIVRPQDAVPPAVAAAAESAAATARAEDRAGIGTCWLVDTDAGLDDARAIAPLLGKLDIRAFIVTEGLARRGPGAAALAHLLERASVGNFPILIGPPPVKSAPEAWLPPVREGAETLNGLLAATASARPDSGAAGESGRGSGAAPTASSATASARPGSGAAGEATGRGSGATPTASLTANGDGATGGNTETFTRLAGAFDGCTGIGVLVLGPWTSFERYRAQLGARVRRVIAQGAGPDDLEAGARPGFNCRYDASACERAYLALKREQLGEWIDLPAQTKSQYNGRPATWSALAPAGAAGAIRAMMLARPPREPPGPEAALRDEAVTVYLLKPESFVQRGGHLEPLGGPLELEAAWLRAFDR